MRRHVVGIVGLSGSGKTSFLRELVESLPAGACAVLSQDDYYRPLEQQQLDAERWPNFDLPTAIFSERFRADLRALLAGRMVTVQRYTFNQRIAAANAVVEPAAVVIVEGLFLCHDAEVRQLLDLRVFIEADAEVCFQRRMSRDQRERGNDAGVVQYQWHNHVLPAYRQFVLPHRDDAHVVVDNNLSFAEGLQQVGQIVRGWLDASAPLS